MNIVNVDVNFHDKLCLSANALYMDLPVRKPALRVCDQAPGYKTYFMLNSKALIRLIIYAGWSEPLLVTHTALLEVSCHGSYGLSMRRVKK